MELISSTERNRLIESVAHDAFHLELRDDYSVPLEHGPYEKWLGGVVDNDFMGPWLSMIRQLTQGGKTVRRVRVVTEPHTPYVRWEHEGTPLNEKAGEQIRWLPRHELPEGLSFPLAGKDWWLLDDRLLAVGHFDDTGRVLGSELIDDPETVAECIRVRDLLWETSIRHSEYKP